MLDKENLKIIEELKNNSRSSVREIAKKTGIRPSTVHFRVNKMIKSGLIEKFTIKLDNKKSAQSFIVFILLQSDKEIPNSFFRSDVVKEVFGVTGENDLLIKCKFKDIYEFNEFILNFRKIPQVKKTVTMVATAVLKEEI